MTAMYRRDDNTSFAAQLANNNVACRLLLSSNIKVELTTPFLFPITLCHCSFPYSCVYLCCFAFSCLLLKTSLRRYKNKDFHYLMFVFSKHVYSSKLEQENILCPIRKLRAFSNVLVCTRSVSPTCRGSVPATRCSTDRTQTRTAGRCTAGPWTMAWRGRCFLLLSRPALLPSELR